MNVEREAGGQLALALCLLCSIFVPATSLAAQPDVEALALAVAELVGSRVEPCKPTQAWIADEVEHQLSYKFSHGRDALPRHSLCVPYEGSFKSFKKAFDDYMDQERSVEVKSMSGWRYREPSVTVDKGGEPIAVDKLFWYRRQLEVNGIPVDIAFESTGLVRFWYTSDEHLTPDLHLDNIGAPKPEREP